MARATPPTKPDPTPDAEVPDALDLPGELDGTPGALPPAVEGDATEQEAPETDAEPGRHEKFEAIRPDGTVVIVDRNIDTGKQTVTEK